MAKRNPDLLAELALNVVWPTAALWLLSSPERLGPLGGLFAALLGPLVHAGWSIRREGKPSPFLWIALLGAGLTGGIGLFELPARWFAAKEALLPLAMTTWAGLSAWRGQPMVAVLLERILDAERIRQSLDPAAALRWSEAQRTATYGLGASFLYMGLGSAVLAVLLVQADAGTEAFNQELASYTVWSFPAINLPGMVLTAVVLSRLLTTLESLTGRPADEWVR